MNSTIVTGASGSMGAAAVKALAAEGRPVIMACRNLEKGEAVRQGILARFPEARIDLRQVNLASIKSINEFADGLAGVPLDGLFNNAGTLNRDFRLTVDGLEETMAVNFVAPFILTGRLLGQMTENAHIVNMVSLTCRLANLKEGFLTPHKEDFSQLGTYSTTKLALLLFTIALARRTGLSVNMSDPGVVNSNMITMGRWFDPLADVLFRPFCKKPEKGVQPALNALESDRTLKFFVGNSCREVPKKYFAHPLLPTIWDYTSEFLSKL